MPGTAIVGPVSGRIRRFAALTCVLLAGALLAALGSWGAEAQSTVATRTVTEPSRTVTVAATATAPTVTVAPPTVTVDQTATVQHLGVTVQPVTAASSEPAASGGVPWWGIVLIGLGLAGFGYLMFRSGRRHDEPQPQPPGPSRS